MPARHRLPALLCCAGITTALSLPAWAGDLIVQADVPAKLSLGTTPLLSTWGTSALRVTGVDPGVASLRVVRGQRTDLIDVVVPESGAVLLHITDGELSTQPQANLDSQPQPAPVVELRAATGQRFGIVLDGARLGVVGAHYPLRLQGVAPGPHALELRSADLTVIWTRADLDLQPNDVVIITGQEGYAPLVSARPEAVRLLGTTIPSEDQTTSSPSQPMLSDPAFPGMQPVEH
ncbi:MAG: hypothetical protein GXP62_03110 [Oligoflexia bacterium]|nr:hypothetical protein [Oligoflexia bacterium]